MNMTTSLPSFNGQRASSRKHMHQRLSPLTSKLVHSPSKFGELQTQVDLFMHKHSKVPADERLSMPLPLNVLPESRLEWMRQPIRSFLPSSQKDDAHDRSAARIDCSLSLLCQRMLVVFGGRDSRSMQTLSDPMACDAVLRQWHPVQVEEVGSSPGATVFAPCARSAHAAAVLGRTQSLLALCGGEDRDGTFLGDVQLLEMRSPERSDQVEARRQIRAERGQIFEALVSLCSRQSTLRSSLDEALTLTSCWEKLVAETGNPASGDDEYLRRNLDELQGRVAQLCHQLQNLDKQVAAQLRLLDDHSGIDCVGWRWLHVLSLSERDPGSKSAMANQDMHMGVACNALRRLHLRGQGDSLFVPRRRHAVCALDNELWCFGGEVRAQDAPKVQLNAALPSAKDHDNSSEPWWKRYQKGERGDKNGCHVEDDPEMKYSRMRRGGLQVSVTDFKGENSLAAKVLANATEIENMSDEAVYHQALIREQFEPANEEATAIAMLMRSGGQTGRIQPETSKYQHAKTHTTANAASTNTADRVSLEQTAGLIAGADDLNHRVTAGERDAPAAKPSYHDDLMCAGDLLYATVHKTTSAASQNEQSSPTARVIWRRVQANGQNPAPRFGHAMCSTDRKILLQGGVGYRSPPPAMRLLASMAHIESRTLSVLGDLHVFDRGTLLWSQPELSGWRGTRRAFHTMAPLDGRVLVMGGMCGRENQAVADAATFVLAPRTAKGGEGFWTHPLPVRPSNDLKRSHCGATVVDGRLLMFGGLGNSNEPCTDMLQIDVGACALLNVSPMSTSVAGGETLTLIGRNFLLNERANASVRVWYDSSVTKGGGSFIELPAHIDASDRAICVCPRLEDRISDGTAKSADSGAPYMLSTGRVDLEMLDESNAASCILGPGKAKHTAVAGAHTKIRIIACNTTCLHRRRGGDRLALAFESIPCADDSDRSNDAAEQVGAMGKKDQHQHAPLSFTASSAKAAPHLNPEITSVVDHHNGRYTIAYRAPSSCGVCALRLSVNDIEGPSTVVEIVPAVAEPCMTLVTKVPEVLIAGESCLIGVQPRDAFGNPCELETSQVSAILFAMNKADAQAEASQQSEVAQVQAQPPQAPRGPMTLHLSPTRAGAHRLCLKIKQAKVNVRGLELMGDGVRLQVRAGRVSAPHSVLLERAGQRGLCASAMPPRSQLLPNPKGHELTVITYDAHGNAVGAGGNEVRAELNQRTFRSSSSTLSRSIRKHLSPLDPEDPAITDHGDGSYTVHVPGWRPCLPPRPAVTPIAENELSQMREGDWLNKIVRKMGSHFEALAIVDRVQGSMICIRWIDSGMEEIGYPADLLGGVTQQTLVSDQLHGRTVHTAAHGALEVKKVMAPENASGPLRYLCDDGSKLCTLSVSELLEGMEQHRQLLLQAGCKEVLWGDFQLKIFVNGALAKCEMLSIPDPEGLFQDGSVSAPTTRSGMHWKHVWGRVERSLEYRGVKTDARLKSVLAALSPQLENVFFNFAARHNEERSGPNNEDHMEGDPKHSALGSSRLGCSSGSKATRTSSRNNHEASQEGHKDSRHHARRLRQSSSISHNSSLMKLKSDTSSPMMSMEDWWEMSKRCGFTQNGVLSGRPTLTQAKIDELLPHHSMSAMANGDESESDRCEGFGTNLALDFEGFLEGMVMVSLAKADGVPASAAVEQLLSKSMFELAVSPPADPLRQELRHSVECRKLTREMQRPLREIYSFWAQSDEREARADLLSCKEAMLMLQKSAIIGQRLSIVTVRELLLKILFDTSTGVYSSEHEDMHLVFGDFVELLARAAQEYFHSSKTVNTLADRLQLVVHHVHLASFENSNVAPLKEPRRMAQRSSLAS